MFTKLKQFTKDHSEVLIVGTVITISVVGTIVATSMLLKSSQEIAENIDLAKEALLDYLISPEGKAELAAYESSKTPF